MLFDQHFGNLHSVQGCALAQIIRHAPEIQAVFHRDIFADAGDKHIILTLNFGGSDEAQFFLLEINDGDPRRFAQNGGASLAR